MNAKQIFLSAFFIAGCISASRAQPTLNDCSGMACENGILDPALWKGEWGRLKVSPSGVVTYLETNFGLSPDHFKTHKPSDGYVVANKLNCDKILCVPQGKPISIQIGTDYGKYRYERLSTSFLVQPNSTMLQVQFAVVMYDPNDHTPAQKPKFQFKIRDKNNNPIPCGQYEVVAGGNIPGFQNCGNVRYRNWTSASIDLRAYAGEVVTIELGTYNCGKGNANHYALALFTIECLQSAITTVSPFCPGGSNAIQLAAPPGFTNYQWSTGQTGQVVTIPNPILGDTVSVSFQPYSSLSHDCLLELEYRIPTATDLNIIEKPAVSFCEGSAVLLTGMEVNGRYRWNTGDTTAFLEVKTPGIYTVEYTFETCKFYDTVQVNQVALPRFTLEQKNVTCQGLNNGGLCAKPINAGTITYQWITGETTPCIAALPPGVYTVTLTEGTLGCTMSDNGTIIEPTQLSAESQIIRLPKCRDWLVGTAIATTTGGTQPYSILWSNGQTETIASIEQEGSCTVTVTDVNGCTATSELEVQTLTFTEKHEDNFCFKDKKGWIELDLSGGIAPYQARLFPEDFQTGFVFKNLSSGIYTIEIQDATGCIQTRSIEIAEQRVEPFQIVLPASLKSNIGDPIEITPVFNFPTSGFQWLAPGVQSYCDDCSDLIGTAVKSGLIQLFATDLYGCTDTAEMYLNVSKERAFYAPNVFCPDAAQVENQYWRVYPRDNQIIRIVALNIYDRWGNWRFGAKNCFPSDKAADWDGVNAQPGVYTWTLELEYIDHEIVRYNGDLSLIQCNRH
ncbi:MAG: hypothetical protein IT262_07235 [Saprospiraceae bacterium]|nr:hypothetical protein [Saprospiraceae bacterium]